MRPITTAVLLGGFLSSLPALAQDSTATGPDEQSLQDDSRPARAGPLTVVPPPVHGPSYGEGTTDEFTFSTTGT